MGPGLLLTVSFHFSRAADVRGRYLGTFVSSPTIQILYSSSNGGLLAFATPSYVSARLVCFLCSALLDDAFTIGRDGCSDDICC